MGLSRIVAVTLGRDEQRCATVQVAFAVRPDMQAELLWRRQL